MSGSWGASPTSAGAAVRGGRTGLWLLGASVLVAVGLAQVYAAKSGELSAGAARLARGEVLNLNRTGSAEELLPFLTVYSDAAARRGAAESASALIARERPLRNVGALAALRRDGFPLSRLKPLLVVRTPREFERELSLWVLVYFAAFWAVALGWHVLGFRGDRSPLAALHLLTGLGLALMVSLRDPLRDSLEFRKFAIGAACGCLLLLLPLFKAFDYRRFAQWCYTPLFAALGLFALLLGFGSGPAGATGIKVNLGPFQPVEAIKICLVLFLAGYFARHWERLRDLREKRLLPGFLRAMGVPRFDDWLPVCCAVAASLTLFFVLKDLGPALVTFFVFLTMFVVARGCPALALAAVAAMAVGVTVGYKLGTPHTVVERIGMWLAPWDNDVRGGNQLAHSLWALATGGAWGSGPGWGDPAMIPAGNTDLVLPALGEEWGFAGVAAVVLLFGFLVWRALRAARRAASAFGYFLALGMASLVAFEMTLITAGVLGALPLSGVVSPFLSSGNTAMLANFFVFAVVLSVSAHAREDAGHDLLERPTRRVAAALAAAGVALLGMAFRYQVLADGTYLAREARTYEQDGVKRAERNPRLNSIAREIPRGGIVDRNGLPVATSDWSELERHRAEYAALGVDIDRACSRLDARHYPFGAATVHITGDLRTGENFHASNASLVEHDANWRLLGYGYSELVPLMRTRHEPGNRGLARILARDRTVRLTLDMRLQLRAREILQRSLRASGTERGAVVAMDAAEGDVLALVSEPAAAPPGVRGGAATPDELLDRARYGQYPPGSTFKLVTAMAALRKDAGLWQRSYTCRGLAGGRPGATIAGWNRPIYDDIGDHAHGTLQMERAIAVSCNAYFAQLGVNGVGAAALRETAELVGLSTGELPELRKALPFAAYGQGEVLTTPFKTARVSAAIASGGRMPQGRWIVGEGNARAEGPREVLPRAQAEAIARGMRQVVVAGTARRAMNGVTVSVAGKTGTAQLDSGAPHSWFTGFAPYDGAGKRLAFAVLVEHGGYGGRVAAPAARELVEAAHALGLIE